MGRFWISLGLLLWVAPAPALANGYYEYKTDGGVISYTDDRERIPARYQANAALKSHASLWDYDRVSISAKGAAAATTKTTLPAEPAPEAKAARARPTACSTHPESRGHRTGDRILIGGRDVAVDLALDDNDEPLRIERRRYTTLDGDYITNADNINPPTTVIRRGDRELVYIDERDGYGR